MLFHGIGAALFFLASLKCSLVSTKDLLGIDGIDRVLEVFVLPPLSSRVASGCFVNDWVLVDECCHDV